MASVQTEDGVYEECDFSGLPKVFCAHCKGDTLGDEKPPVYGNDDPAEFEIERVFTSQFNGTCTIDREHRVRRGDKVAIVHRADNPMLKVSGVACKECIRNMPHE